MALLFLVFLFRIEAHAGCTSPAGIVGQFEWYNPTTSFRVCDGNAWVNVVQGTTTAATCTVKTFKYITDAYQYCSNGSTWVSMKPVASDGTCVLGDFQKLFYLPATAKMQFCDGADLWTIAQGTPADPCLVGGAAIGSSCAGGAYYAGPIDPDGGGAAYTPKTYMVMQGGCDGTTNNPICGAVTDATPGVYDSIKRKWDSVTTNQIWESAPPRVTHVATRSTLSGVDGTAGMISKGVTNGTAAHYCNDMIAHGYNDWVLPSKSELAYIYCKAIVDSPLPNPSYPDEDPNCAVTGRQALIPGFSGYSYYASTENYMDKGLSQSFQTGRQSISDLKTTERAVRCVREVGPCGPIGSACQGGYYAGQFNGQHYIAAPANCDSMVPSNCNHAVVDAATMAWTSSGIAIGGDDILDGGANTAIQGPNAVSLASKRCDNMQIGAYVDWFLPASKELEYLRTMKSISSLKFATTLKYWSSTESTPSLAMIVDFSTAAPAVTGNKITPIAQVRCLRIAN